MVKLFTPPHSRSSLDAAERQVVDAAREMVRQRIPGTSTYPQHEAARLSETVLALDAKLAANDAARDAFRAEVRATPTHLFAKAGDKRALCGDDSGQGGLARFAARWQSNGQAVCGECLAAIPDDAVWDDDGVIPGMKTLREMP
jgi:hypothetical protein